MAGRGRGGSFFYLSIGGDRKLFPALLCRDFQGRRCSRCADNIAFYFIFCIFFCMEFRSGHLQVSLQGLLQHLGERQVPTLLSGIRRESSVFWGVFCNGNAAIGCVTSCVCFCCAVLDRNTREQALVGSHKQSKHGIMES